MYFQYFVKHNALQCLVYFKIAAPKKNDVYFLVYYKHICQHVVFIQWMV